jgi:hypothetical protein
MLDSTIQQLAGADRESKLDAYMMLVRALKASNNLPDRVALQEKMSIFMQFMQRDITAKSESGSLDSSLANHALTLLITFLHFPAIASTLSNDFGIFIIDHCIRSFGDLSVAKDGVRHLMQVVASQNFSPKVMTSDRVGRLISALHKIDEHIKGKSIVMSRVLIYRKLVKQSKQLMLIHSEWLFDLLTDMLSGLKEIRSAAIALGLEAAYSIGRDKALSRKVMEMLNLTVEEKTYVEYYEEKLRAFAKDKNDCVYVPQIWSVVMLLLRLPFDKWDLFGRWLHIIQVCFNCSDFATKIEANLAWGRFVYLAHLDERAFSKKIATLSQPLASQLKRKGTGKSVEDLRKAVIGGICNLFYYAFKPTNNVTTLDTHWDNSVKPLIKQLLDPKVGGTHDDFVQASIILNGLFDSTTPRLWKEDRIADNTTVKPEELPAIDSKWIRRNGAKVFSLVEPILARDVSALADSSSAAYKLWKALVGTVASAASKEIKVSMDTSSFVAHALNVLQNLWKAGPKDISDADSKNRFLEGVLSFVGIMVDSLGVLPFTEKLLAMDKRNHLVPTATPTNRPGKAAGTSRTPLHHLFSILSALPPLISDDEDFADFFKSAMAPFFTAKTEKGRMDLAQDLMSTLPMDASTPYGPWLFTSEKISTWLLSGHNSAQSNASGSEAPVGHDYRDVVRLLERGLKSTPNLPWNHWQSLFGELHQRCRDETGDAGVAIVVIEPLAKTLVDMSTAEHPTDSSVLIRVAIELLSGATHPRDRHAVDGARRRLWGTVVSGPRSASFDTFDSLYRLVNLALDQAYREANPTTSGEGVSMLLKDVGDFFDRSNQQLLFKSLAAFQDGLVAWIRDELAQVSGWPVEVLETVRIASYTVYAWVDAN